eukprot:TRINITY_DN9402_c0_g1_i2.p2 TRINITY_DN9402_c0_g1~~TRINITY_DN9402_c0_g1_i2.p2  ORF type:complete len:125 (-),score=12.10 TRINITY_DN9402_c0_g1_i2:112-486(-)
MPKLPAKYDLTQLYNSTILLADNAALTALTKKVPLTQMDRLIKALEYMTIRGRVTVPQMKKAAQGKSYNTWLKKPLLKMSAANSDAVTFGASGSPSSQWTTIIYTKLYTGPYFTAHGINYAIVV